MRTLKIFSLIVYLSACGASSKERAYEEAAERVNPILFALRPTAAKMRALPKTENDAVTQVCGDARDLFYELRKIDFGAREETAALFEFTPAWVAQDLSGVSWDSWCRFDWQRNRIDPYGCWLICTRAWNHLAYKMEQLRFCAAKQGVDIVSIGGTSDPPQRCP